MPATPASPRWGRYETLLPDEIAAIAAQHSVAYLPWGALEYHGRHAAVGLDGLKAHGLCCSLAAAVGGLVFPPVYFAANTIKTLRELPHQRHSLNFSEDLLRLLAREHLEQLADEKFRVVFVLCGHVGQPHYDIIKAEAAALNARQSATRVIATSETDLISPDLVVANHAALGEISFLMSQHPECVDLSRLPADRVPTLEQDAVWGSDPREASAEKGRLYTDAFIAGARPLIAALASS
ncbi:creatininase family protein [Horticoccus luteus]|uniref:Creatininase family protein n=1 Tax=Horticoccus luteus TaxID=2862869 RepID=A0A8F9TTW4_9BACT|nr:creatininase family protein [Horticoccus luteus]QYM78012.1 creatininase family protein [Horticoccus luteus]